MDKNLLQELKTKLEAERDQIQRELEEFATPNKNKEDDWNAKYPPKGEHLDKDEVIEEMTEFDTNVSLEESLEKRLHSAKVALKKIEEGNYGICEKCGKEIEDERLKAYPDATKHTNCQ